MDTNRLRYFSTIAKTGSLRKAAELLNVSPAALSKSIKILESELNCKLLEADGRGIIVTDEGKSIALHIDDILGRIAHLTAPTEIAETTQILRLGSFEVFTTYFLGHLLRSEFPSSPVEIHELLPGHLETALANNIIDIGLTYIPAPHPDIEHLKIAKITMAIFGRKHIFGQTPFCDLPFAVPIQPITGTATKVLGLDGWPDQQFPRRHAYRVTLMESALELCRQGLAVAYLPAFAVRLHNKSVNTENRLYEIKSEKIPGSVNAYIVKRKSMVEKSAVKKIARCLRQVCSDSEH